MDKSPEKEIVKRWNKIEPKLKIGEKIDKKLYDEIIWFDYWMSRFYSIYYGGIS